MRKKICIYNKDGELLNEFEISFFQRNKNELQLDLESFYKKHSGIIPEKNVEMRLDESAPFTVPTLLEFKTHIHLGKDMEWYICYPSKLNSIDEAIKFAADWCLITTFHLTQKADVAWFEDFGNWMIRKTQTYQDPPNSFKEFPLWIQNGFLKWSVKMT